MSQSILTIITLTAAFCGAAALVAAVVSLLRARRGSIAEVRLNELAKATAAGNWGDSEEDYHPAASISEEAERPAEWERWLARFLDLRTLIRQAGVRITPVQLLALTGASIVAGSTLGGLTPAPATAMPVGAALAGSLPLLWLLWKRHQRLGKFESQMPDAMDLLARSLRAGHSMADGLRLIGDEMAEPISAEFLRCYQQQALGVPLEATLEELTARVPNLDLRFFVNAVVLQRQTGGDTAEILDKIARLIRQRFQIRAQVRALTGEGRLSGLVLLALPIVLAIYLYFRNPDYLMILFREPLGQKMVLAAIVLQLMGAVVIKKIVDIKI
jgi:tight adherence protein B